MAAQDPFLDQVTALLPALRAFGRSLCGDPARADDLVQDTVLKAWTNREQFQSGSNLKAWLFTILRNCYYSELRHRKFEVEDPEGVCAAQMSVAPIHDASSPMPRRALATACFSPSHWGLAFSRRRPSWVA